MNSKFIVMGVSGSGKSLIGSALAKHFDADFFDGDDYHPADNVAKMRAGIPLTDADRYGWLLTLNQLLNKQDKIVLACSGLKPEYRRLLRSGNNAQLIYLKGDKETIWERHSLRKGHYFNGRTMLDSQFEELIEPLQNESIHIDIKQSVAQVMTAILKAIAGN